MSNLQLVPVPQGKNVKAQEVEMRVPLYSYGCERKIRKALSHIKGLYSVEADVAHQKVTVVGMLDRNEVLEAVKAKRKDADFWTNDQQLRKPAPSVCNPSVPNVKAKTNSATSQSLETPEGAGKSKKLSSSKGRKKS